MDLHRVRSKHPNLDARPPELMEDVIIRMVGTININGKVTPDISVTHHDTESTSRETAVAQTRSRTSNITFAELATRWNIGLETAKATLAATTQEGMRFVDGDLERWLRTSLRFPTLNCTIYTDTMFAKLKSVRGFTCAQLFTDGKGFYRLYPMKKKGDAHHALSQFIHDVGIPKNCLVDGVKEEREVNGGRL